MCGICGIILKNRQTTDEDRAILHRMMSVLKHRGPDESGSYFSRVALLGHQRLSIIDLKGGKQPLHNENKQIWISYNGEIYNFPELRKELLDAGHIFSTNTDTEVIIHAYEEWGEKALSRLNGMFAFGLWDESKHQLFLARDRVGKKPLYYYENDEIFVFASELKSLLVNRSIPRNISPVSVALYFFFGYIPSPLSIFKEIHKLPPAHFLLFSNNKATICPYWKLNTSSRIKDIRTAKEALLPLLQNAVSSRLISDVPLGAFLSGGIDSSTIVALMSLAQKDKISTFSIGFPDQDYNELDDARRLASAIGTKHHELILEPEDTDIIYEIVNYCDEPFADASAIPTYYVSKLASQHVKVVLSGDGGDELFGGYTRYLPEYVENISALLPSFLAKICFTIAEYIPEALPGKYFIESLSYSPQEHYLSKIGCFPDIRRYLFNDNILKYIGFERKFLEDCFDEVIEDDQIQRESYFDFKTYLPDDILVKVDRMTMAHSLEARAPLLDYRLVELAFSMSSDLKIKNGITKYVLKESVRNIVPESVLTKKKQGFAVPLQGWFSNDLDGFVKDILLDQRSLQREHINPKMIRRIIELHSLGRRNYSTWLWKLMVLELWQRLFID